MVLPVLHALQGHPESGRLWEEHINPILSDLGFTTTTHCRTIYTATIDGEKVLLLRQVDDFALACKREELAKKIYASIGKRLQLPTEDSAPFTYLGLLTSYNGVDIAQCRDSITIHCENYISRVLKAHGWLTEDEKETRSTRPVPLRPELSPAIFKTAGPPEGSAEYAAKAEEHGFSYRTVLGELLYAYVICRLDIGYAVTTLSKFAIAPADIHYKALKDVAVYLRRTINWGLVYQRSTPDDSLPTSNFERIPPDPGLPAFPLPDSSSQLVCFVDSAHANDLRNRRSTTGYICILAGAAVSYRTKTQNITATSSTEAEFLAAVLAAKHVKYLRAVLHELGFSQPQPTPIYEDNMSAINMINARVPTDRSRHIDIQHFAIQDWKDAGDIVMRHIPGILNPSDDLTKPLGWVLHARHSRRMMGHIT